MRSSFLTLIAVVSVLLAGSSFLLLRPSAPASAPAPPTPTYPTNPLAMSAGSAAKQLVDKLIKENIVMVFSKSYCPYCAKAKNVFAQYKLKSYKVLELDERDDGDAIQDYLGQITPGRSVPRVFVGGQFLGGGDDTAAQHANGQLKAKLEAAGAL